MNLYLVTYLTKYHFLAKAEDVMYKELYSQFNKVKSTNFIFCKNEFASK